MNINRLTIKRPRFSESICAVAHTYGFKTIGQMKSAMTKAMPFAKWSYGMSHIRTATILHALDAFKGDTKLPF